MCITPNRFYQICLKYSNLENWGIKNIFSETTSNKFQENIRKYIGNWSNRKTSYEFRPCFNSSNTHLSWREVDCVSLYWKFFCQICWVIVRLYNTNEFKKNETCIILSLHIYSNMFVIFMILIFLWHLIFTTYITTNYESFPNI